MSTTAILDILPPPNLQPEEEHRYLVAALHRFTETTVRVVDSGERTKMERPIWQLELVAGEPGFLNFYSSTPHPPHPNATKLALDLLLAWRFYRAGESRTNLAILAPLLAAAPIPKPEADPLLVAVLLGTIGTTAYLIWRNSYERNGIDPDRIQTETERKRQER